MAANIKRETYERSRAEGLAVKLGNFFCFSATVTEVKEETEETSSTR